MMVSVGHENFANSRFIIAILKPDSSPLKKLRRSAEDERMLINATSQKLLNNGLILINRKGGYFDRYANGSKRAYF
jgi:regulator of extracellular matrix RemA (YlzA/DUF370 family)